MKAKAVTKIGNIIMSQQQPNQDKFLEESKIFKITLVGLGISGAVLLLYLCLMVYEKANNARSSAEKQLLEMNEVKKKANRYLDKQN